MRKSLGVAFVSLVFAVTVVGCGDDEQASDAVVVATATATTPTQTTTTATTAEPAETIADAQEAVDDGDYGNAVAIATALGAAEANAIRRRIANRIARRAIAAVRKGDRAAAQRFLAQADRYPTTTLTRQARGSYKAAKARAAARRRAIAVQKQRDAAAKRAAKQAEEQQQTPEPSVPSGTCADTSMTDFPVPPGDSRDRDGDGIACES